MYMAADTNAIPVLNDEVGGVTVTIGTEGMELRTLLQKGETVTLQGKQAEIFVRYRDANALTIRHCIGMDQQQQYIKGFFEAVQRHSLKTAGLWSDCLTGFRNTWSLTWPRTNILK